MTSKLIKFKKAILFPLIKLFFILSGLLAGIMPTLSQEPVVFKASWRIDPGEVIGIFGGNLISASGSDKPVVMALALSQFSGDLSAGRANLQLPLINTQENLIHAMMPSGAAKDVYALWVKNSGGTSEPVFINRAEPWWISERSAYAGQIVRLIGRNFIHPADRSPVSAYQSEPPVAGISAEMVEVGSGKRLPVNIVASTDFALDFEIPKAATEGAKYSLRVTNGAGGVVGWVQLPDEETFTIVSGQADPLDLSAAWVSQIQWDNQVNVRDIGAKGDGIADDSGPIQRAADQVAAAGGGVVYLPAGIYLFSGLKLGARTVVLGQGRNVTRLVYNGKPTPTPAEEPGSNALIGGKKFVIHSWPSKLIYSEAPAVGLARLTVENPVERPVDDSTRRIAGYVTMVQFTGGSRASGNPVRGQFLKEVRLLSVDGGGVVLGAASDVIVEGCDIEVTHGPLDLRVREGYQRIRNNIFINTQRPGINGIPSRAWIEGNTLIGRPIARPVGKPDELGTSEHRVMDIGGSEIFMANNRIEGAWGKPNSNEGEGLCWQNQQRLAFSRVTSGNGSTVTDNTQTWTPDAFKGAKVAIISGRGLGQMRLISSNSDKSMTVIRPWQIEPDKTSIYTVDPHITTHCIVVGNQILASLHKGGITFYTKDYDNIVIGNTLANNGGIWLTSTQVAQQKRADFSYFAYVVENRITGASTSPEEGNRKGNSVTIGPAADGGIGASPAPEIPAVGIYGHEIRRNSLTGLGSNVPYSNDYSARFITNSGIYISSPSKLDVPLSQGSIIERNRVKNTFAGVHLSNTSYDVILHDNDFSGNGKDIANDRSVRMIEVKGEEISQSPKPISPANPPARNRNAKK